MVLNYEDFYLGKTFFDEREQEFSRLVKERVGFVIVESYHRPYTVENKFKQSELYLWIDTAKTPTALESVTQELMKNALGGWAVNDILGKTTDLIFDLYFTTFNLSPSDPNHLFLHISGYKEALLSAIYGRSTPEISERIVKSYPEIPAECIMYGYNASILILAMDADMAGYLENRRDKLAAICRKVLVKHDHRGIFNPEIVAIKIVNRCDLDRDTLKSVLMCRRGVNSSL